MNQQSIELQTVEDAYAKTDNHLSVLQRMNFAERLAKLGYWELDIKAKRFYWSAEMYQIFGVEANKTNNKKNLFREQVLPDDLHIYKEKIADLLKYRKPVEGEIRIRHSSGHIVYCKFTAGIKGNRIAGTFQNISDWVSQRQAMKKAQEKAEEANRAKSYFLAQASHDLRQPLQALQMFTDALESSNPSPEQMPLIQKIDASVGNFKLLLDNLLDLSKLDFDKVTYEPQNFNLSLLLQRMCMEYKAVAAKRDVRVQCRIPLIWIYSDYLLLERILRNLLSNAVKYARNKVILACEENRNHIIIRVIDNGIGIKSSEHCQVFDEFYQSRDVPGNRIMGAGLGLSIVKKLTAVLKGTVTLRSVPGKYTIFSVYLPHKI